MDEVVLGRTGLRVSTLGLGGGGDSRPERARLRPARRRRGHASELSDS